MTNFWVILLVWFKISQPVLLWFLPRSFVLNLMCAATVCMSVLKKVKQIHSLWAFPSVFFLSNTAYFEAILPSVHDVSCKQSWVSLFEGVFREKSVAKEEAIPMSATALTSGGLSAPQLQVTAFFSTGNCLFWITAITANVDFYLFGADKKSNLLFEEGVLMNVGYHCYCSVSTTVKQADRRRLELILTL